MEVQQIRLNINRLVNKIEDEEFLNACYEAVEGIAKAYRRMKERANGYKGSAPETSEKNQPAENSGEQTIIEHDLSLILMANEVLKGSQPMPEEGEIAFEKALKKSLKSQATLPNRQ